jgi:hypothetical protein
MHNCCPAKKMGLRRSTARLDQNSLIQAPADRPNQKGNRLMPPLHAAASDLRAPR